METGVDESADAKTHKANQEPEKPNTLFVVKTTMKGLRDSNADNDHEANYPQNDSTLITEDFTLDELAMNEARLLLTLRHINIVRMSIQQLLLYGCSFNILRGSVLWIFS